MKKVLALVLVLVVCVTGTALARTNDRQPRRNMPPQRMERSEMPGRGPRWQNVSGDFRPGFNGMGCGFGFGDGRRFGTFTPDMPKEIRGKAAELAKLRIDLEEAMTSRPVNKEKAIEVYAKIQKVKQEIETWRFTQRLERIEARQKKGLPPAPEDVSPSAEEAETPAE